MRFEKRRRRTCRTTPSLLPLDQVTPYCGTPIGYKFVLFSPFVIMLARVVMLVILDLLDSYFLRQDTRLLTQQGGFGSGRNGVGTTTYGVSTRLDQA